MNVLITGATGFVGKALGASLAAQGWRVRGVVRTAADCERLPAGVEAAVAGSLGPDTVWSPWLDRVRVVVHLAARTHVIRERDRDPLSAYRTINVAATECLARAAVHAGVKRFVFLSSVKVNGEGRTTPYTEQDPPRPEDAYGITKWEAEQTLLRIADETGMEVVIIRPPLVYGEGVKANFLLLLNAVRRGIPLPLASIRNVRSLIYLHNLTDAIRVCALHPAAAGRTYLVSDGQDLSTPDLVRRIAAAFGRQGRLVPFPPSLLRLIGRATGRSSAVERLMSSLVIDSSRIRQELGWKPPISLDDGLKATATWFLGRSGGRS